MHFWTQVLYRRLESGKGTGEKGFVLDGFPRTHAQVSKIYSQKKFLIGTFCVCVCVVWVCVALNFCPEGGGNYVVGAGPLWLTPIWRDLAFDDDLPPSVDVTYETVCRRQTL